MSIKKIEITGTEYEVGFKTGVFFKEYLNNRIGVFSQKLSNHETYITVKQMEKKLRLEFPLCLQEIYGRADGANVSRDAILLMFFPEIFKAIDGCTTLLLKKENGNFLFSHNEDDKNYNSANTALVKYKLQDYWIVGYTMAEKLLGSSFAYNSYGLIFSSNYIFDTKINLNNISRYIMARDIMSAKNISEVVAKMKSHQVASAFSLNILDTNLKKAINIEKDIDDAYITDIADTYARSNHFICKQNDLPKEPISSSFRYKKSKELLRSLNKNNCQIENLIEILNYETGDYYKSIYKNPNKYSDLSVTVSNFSYDGDNGLIYIKDYLNDAKVITKYDVF